MGRIEQELEIVRRTFGPLTPVVLMGRAALAAAAPRLDERADEVRSFARRLDELGHAIFVGIPGDAPSTEAHRLFVVPGLRPPDIAEVCRVGSHNSVKPEPWTGVRTLLERIHARRRFSAYFADSAGYKAVFHGSVPEAEAREFEDWICKVNPEAGCVADDEGLEVWQLIALKSTLQLWWD